MPRRQQEEAKVPKRDIPPLRLRCIVSNADQGDAVEYQEGPSCQVEQPACRKGSAYLVGQPLHPARVGRRFAGK